MEGGGTTLGPNGKLLRRNRKDIIRGGGWRRTAKETLSAIHSVLSLRLRFPPPRREENRVEQKEGGGEDHGKKIARSRT